MNDSSKKFSACDKSVLFTPPEFHPYNLFLQNLAGQAASRQANGPEADSLDASFHNAHLKEEIDNPCAMVFLDGTKTIFNDALIGQGKTGAQSAASQLQYAALPLNL